MHQPFQGVTRGPQPSVGFSAQPLDSPCPPFLLLVPSDTRLLAPGCQPQKSVADELRWTECESPGLQDHHRAAPATSAPAPLQATSRSGRWRACLLWWFLMLVSEPGVTHAAPIQKGETSSKSCIGRESRKTFTQGPWGVGEGQRTLPLGFYNLWAGTVSSA